jgi:hypothetical protein
MSSKMREALKEADIVLSVMGYDVCSPIRTQIKQALAEPLRNCDVGTAEEQAERFEAYCDSHTNCAYCPLKGQQCVLAWAQMPYEKGGEE